MHNRFDVFLRCPCGHTARFEAKEVEDAKKRRFRCTQCQRVDPEMAIWPIWQRAMRREGWSPWGASGMRPT